MLFWVTPRKHQCGLLGGQNFTLHPWCFWRTFRNEGPSFSLHVCFLADLWERNKRPVFWGGVFLVACVACRWPRTRRKAVVVMRGSVLPCLSALLTGFWTWASFCALVQYGVNFYSERVYYVCSVQGVVWFVIHVNQAVGKEGEWCDCVNSVVVESGAIVLVVMGNYSICLLCSFVVSVVSLWPCNHGAFHVNCLQEERSTLHTFMCKLVWLISGCEKSVFSCVIS